MRQQKCKRGKLGFCYDYGNCCDCEINQMILRYESKIKRLKAEKERLTINKKNAIKEFAEKLKNHPPQSEKSLVWEYGEGWFSCWEATKKAIDELLKEYEK